MLVPSYLKSEQALYEKNPKQAAISWFEKAGFGLFLHYGIYSVLGHGEWAMFKETIAIEQYTKLKDQFTAENFDADFITDLALEAEMKYVNITTRHHDGFSLFKSSVSDYTSLNSPAKRDLVGELAEACERKGLGLFLYYSHSLDWYHPYALPNQYGDIYRPNYAAEPQAYRWQCEADFSKYLDFIHAQLTELLTNYGPVAGVWFDPLNGYFAKPEIFEIEKTYALIRELQPQTLISYKYGANGTEDFISPERYRQPPVHITADIYGEKSAKMASDAWESNKHKPAEICNTLQPCWWGCVNARDTEHRSIEDIESMIANSVEQKANLLLNTGPLADGSIHRTDAALLREIGKRIRASGWNSFEQKTADVLKQHADQLDVV